MAEKLYLLEFQIGVINFDVLQPPPRKENILVNIRFCDINIDVDPEALPFFKQTDEAGPIEFNMGKSYLFLYNPKRLISDLRREPVELSVRVNNKSEGSAKIKLVEDFSDMVKLNEKVGVVKGVDYTETVPLKNRADEVVGRADFFVRLSGFGDGIETQYQVKTEGDKKEYFFRDPKTPNVFKCEKYQTTDSEMLPVATILNPLIKPSCGGPEERLSWNEIFGGNGVLSKISEAPFIMGESPMTALNEIFDRNPSGDTVSICFRPLENKFFDFLNLMTTEVSACPDNTTVTFTKGGQGERKSMTKGPSRDDDDPLELTADKINRKLCKNRDCPAALKFKEFGIGPLATGKGLGTLYGEVDPPLEYGLSHTYGTMSNYGPYGVFSRPKRLDQPFIPSKNALATPLPPCSNRKEKCCNQTKKGTMRLRGGGMLEEENTRGPRSFPDTSSKHWHHYIPWSRRLRGGGPLGLENMLEPKSPFQECKSVMDQFDDILAAYKKAIGPCGEATCPYAQSMAEESCKRMCEKNKPPEPPEDQMSCSNFPCEIPTCPYKNAKKYPAGCGRPTCAYTQHKLGLVDDEAALELAFLPPAISGKCGHPKCHYPFQSPLPPIHWDCPNPLPNGNCKNQNCPFQPPDLKKLKCPVPKKGPCGSSYCPYALPPPCELPTCPFKPQPVCPFLEKQKKKKRRKTCCPPEEEDDEDCGSPDCPFAPKEANVKGQFTTCANPDCPYATQPESESKNSTCENPGCPFAPPKPKKKQQGCGSPTCPYAPKPKKDNNCASKPKPNPKNGDNCGDPGCPFGAKKQDSNCGDPECPFGAKDNNCGDADCPFMPKPKNNDTCGNPGCPYAQQSESDSDDCDNPDCPFKQTKKKDTCDNPECPSNFDNDSSTESSEICDNPDCPYAVKEVEPICNDPYCPYLMPLPSCGIRYCPFEPSGCPPPPPPCPRPKPAPPKPVVAQQVAPAVRPETISAGNAAAEHGGNVGQGDSKKKKGSVSKGDGKGADKGKGNGKGNGKGKGTGEQGNGKRKKRSKFVYTMCNRYPGVKVGHKECITPQFNVPAKMGWLWNIPYGFLRLKPRRGWKPGALTRFMAAKIRAHRQAQGLGLLQVPKFKRKGKGGRGGGGGSEVSVSPKPTLQIQKKDGAYWITMNPLKDPNTLAENENPYMECTPMQFKITKNKKKRREDGDDDESRLCYCEDEDDSSSSSDSELDIEFTPPAGIIHPERFKKKKDVVHCDTQYDPKDFASKAKRSKDGKDKKGKAAAGGKGDKKKK